MQAIRGVQPLPQGLNPATWMLAATTVTAEADAGHDFADIYEASALAK